jgi:trehalose synthase
MELNAEIIKSYLDDYGIPRDKPIVTQVSRFEPWKDPEGIRIYEHMETIAQPYLERGEVLFIRGDDPILVNVMQRVSDVVLQKSTRSTSTDVPKKLSCSWRIKTCRTS